MDENKIRQIVQEEITNARTKAGYNVSLVPYHEHTGVDSPFISYANVANKTAIEKSIGTTLGDLITFSASATPVRLGIGSNAKVLTADSTKTYGMDWETIPSSSQISASYITGESAVAGAAAAFGGIQADGGIKFDAQDNGSFVAAAGTKDITFTVGNTANRKLVVAIKNEINSNNITATFNGTSMTRDENNTGNLANNGCLTVFSLTAPTVGAHTLTFSNLAAGNTYYFIIYSLYNCAQSAVDSHASTASAAAGGSAAPITATGTTTVNGAVGIAFFTGFGASFTATYTGFDTNLLQVGTHDLDGGISYIQIPMANVVSSVTGWGGNLQTIAAVIGIAPYSAVTYGVVNARSAADNYLNHRATAFCGFYSAVCNAGDTVTIIHEGVVTGLTGISPMSLYYLNDTDGTIGTSVGTVTRKVGIGASTTSLLITNEP